jgi:ABC-type Na+ efflux pump permease subunit
VIVKYVPVVIIAVVVLVIRVLRRQRGGVAWPLRRAPGDAAAGNGATTRTGLLVRLFGDAGLVARREARERVRGQFFRVGTLFILAVVAAAIVIPAETKRKSAAHVAHAAAGHGATASNVGLILVFLMLTQYSGWTLIGVMEEKSSRVAEVLLAAIRPAQLVGGKVLGTGLVAFAQAAVVASVAVGLAKAVGSDLLHGTAPLALASAVAWLLRGDAFYSWAYAAAGSMAERRDQAQSLILPLSVPILASYLLAQTAIVSGHASALVEVLAYLPPTAPLTMPALVSLGAVSWWQFTASALLSVACTVGMARLAIGIYRRAILQTGRRVRLREVLPSAARGT